MHTVATGVAILLLAGAAAAEQMTLYSLAAGDRFVDLGQAGGAGNMTLWHSEIQDEAGSKLGTGAGACIRLDAAGNVMCDLVIQHDGRGTINVSGMQVAEPATATLTIIGGTGVYQGATGQVRDRLPDGLSASRQPRLAGAVALPPRAQASRGNAVA